MVSTKHIYAKNRALALMIALLCALVCAASLLPVSAVADDLARDSLPVTQTVSTSMGNDPAKFWYELSAVSPTDAPLPEGASGSYTFTLPATQKITNPALQIPFTKAGNYEYKLLCYDVAYDGSNSDISDTNGKGEWFVRDVREYTVRANVKDVSGGGLDVKLFVYDANGNKVDPGNTGNALFAHERIKLSDGGGDEQPNPIIAVDPPVKKRIKGKPAKDAEFQFRLRAEESGNPMPAGSNGDEKIITIVGEGSEDFGSWEYSTEGTYNYDISEINTSDADYKYDTKMYTITDVVFRVGNEFRVDRVVVDSNGKQVDSTLITPTYDREDAMPIEFTNEYVGKGEGGGSSGSGGKEGGSSGSDSILGKLPKTYDTYRTQIWVSVALIAAFFVFLAVLRRYSRRDDHK